MANQIISKIQFRNKFVKRFQNCLDSLRDKIEKITIEFVNNTSNDECFKILWYMTYNPSEIFKLFGLQISNPESKEHDENITIFPEDLIIPWRDELRYQRQKFYEDFLKITFSKSCEEAYTALLNSSDAVIATVVYKMCSKLCMYSTDVEIERSLYLLNSSKDENVFGGIRSLHFNREEALFLKKYASKISNLLDALWKEQIEQKKLETNRPLAKQLEAWCQKHPLTDDANDTCSEVTSDGVTSTDTSTSNVEMPSMETSNPAEMLDSEKILSPQNILEDAELFETFIGVYHQLKEVGYEPQKVVGKMEAIVKILEASKILND